MEKYWPFRGGRSVASCGLIQKENVFYMGSTGGGVWKSQITELTGIIFQTGF